jgi:hypothetical protein
MITKPSGSERISKIKFKPTIHEQLLLPLVLEKNVLLSYSDNKRLFRAISLISLLFLSQKILDSRKKSRILFLTKRNRQESVKKALKENLDKIVIVHNGSMLPLARKQDYNIFNMILSTPKIIKNDLKESYFSPDHFQLVIIDYAEMVSSSSSLRYLVKYLKATRIIGLSTERDTTRLQQTCINLRLEEVCKVEDHLILPNRLKVQHYILPLPQEYYFVLNLLDRIKRNELKHLQNLGYSVTPKSTLREITAIHASLINGKQRKILVKTANLQRIMNLQKTIISGGFPTVIEYFEELKKRSELRSNFVGKHSIQIFLSNPVIKKFYEYLTLVKDLQHPKLRFLMKLIREHKNGVSIVTNNHSNAEFLYKTLRQYDFSAIHIDKPISSFSKLNLEKLLFSYGGRTIQVCISNSVNQTIADMSKIIIGYDLGSEIFYQMNALETAIPRVFLITKQTSEEAQFNQLVHLLNKSDSNFIDVTAINKSLKRVQNKPIQEDEAHESKY